MLNINNILQTIQMIDKQHLDIRTVTMGISLRDCSDSDINKSCKKIYDKITKKAQNLVKVTESIEREYGIPIVNKRISVTPVSLVAESAESEDCVLYAVTLDKAAKECGVDFIGGYTALVQKGYTLGDKRLISSLPEALAATDIVCGSVNVASTRTGINMDAVAEMGTTIKKFAESTRIRLFELCQIRGVRQRRWITFMARLSAGGERMRHKRGVSVRRGSPRFTEGKRGIL